MGVKQDLCPNMLISTHLTHLTSEKLWAVFFFNNHTPGGWGGRGYLRDDYLLCSTSSINHCPPFHKHKMMQSLSYNMGVTEDIIWNLTWNVVCQNSLVWQNSLVIDGICAKISPQPQWWNKLFWGKWAKFQAKAQKSSKYNKCSTKRFSNLYW